MVEFTDNASEQPKPATATSPADGSPPPPPPTPSPTLKRAINIPGYTIMSKLGEGASATVWLAQQNSLDRPVAIKMLKRQHSSDPQEVADFINEAKAVAKLKSHGIIQIYDIGRHEQMIFFAMEYVDGETLFRTLQSTGRLEQKRALTIATAVAKALDDAWNSGKIFHRDIKPDNIMLEKGGGIKLADLGLAGIIDPHGGSSVREHEIVGTPHYMSPEQARGDGKLDFHTDMYGLGAMLYHMVTGKIPFDGMENDAVLAAQISEQLPNPRDINPRITPGCAQIIAKLMAKSPKHRYRSWTTAASALSKLASGKLVVTKLPASAKSTIAAAGAIPPPSVQSVRKPSLAAAGAVPLSSVQSARKPGLASKQPLEASKETPAPQRAPKWLRISCELLLLGWFGLLGYQLIWVPLHPADTTHQEPVPPQRVDTPPPARVEQTRPPRRPPTRIGPRPTQPVAQTESMPPPSLVPTTPEVDYTTLKKDILKSLLTEGVAAAQETLKATQSSTDETAALIKLLESEHLGPEGVVRAFERSIGKRSMIIQGGRRHYIEVKSVSGNRITGDIFVGSSTSTVGRPASFSVSQLDPTEQSRWLGAATSPDVAIAKFLLSMNAGDFINARKLAEKCGPLSEACVAEVEARIQMLVE